MNEQTENTNYDYAQEGVDHPVVQKEKVGLGILGAFIGTLIGAVCIVLLGEFGYVAAISGVVMGVCALKGYEILGKGISVKGIVICAILMIVMVYLSNWASYALAVAEVYEADIITSFSAVPALIGEGAIDKGMYFKDLIVLYVFTALGAVPIVRDSLR